MDKKAAAAEMRLHSLWMKYVKLKAVCESFPHAHQDPEEYLRRIKLWYADVERVIRDNDEQLRKDGIAY